MAQQPTQEQRASADRRSGSPGAEKNREMLDRLERQAVQLGQLNERMSQLEHERDEERARREELEAEVAGEREELERLRDESRAESTAQRSHEEVELELEKLRRRNGELEAHLQAAWAQLEGLRDEQPPGRRRWKFRREPDLVEDQ
jgi:chromosome segregation ATPase